MEPRRDASTPHGCFDWLPDELILRILGQLNVKDLRNASEVCSLFRRLYLDDFLWESLLKKMVHSSVRPEDCGATSWKQAYLRYTQVQPVEEFFGHVIAQDLDTYQAAELNGAIYMIPPLLPGHQQVAKYNKDMELVETITWGESFGECETPTLYVYNNHVICASDDVILICNPSLDILQRIELEGVIAWAEWKGLLCAGLDSGDVYAWNSAGKLMWTFDTDTTECDLLEGWNDLLVQSASDTRIQLWSEPGKLDTTLHGHTYPVNCIRAHRNRLYSGSLGMEFRVWDYDSRVCILRLSLPSTLGMIAVWEEKVYVGMLGQLLCLEPLTGRMLEPLGGGFTEIVGTVLVSQGRLVAYDRHGHCKIWSKPAERDST